MIGDIDKEFWDNGKTIIGFDEAGRGPIAGDMFFALVELQRYSIIPFKLKDSKKYQDNKREEVENKLDYLHIINNFYVGVVTVEEINSGKNLNTLLYEAINDAIFEMYAQIPNDFVIFVDGNQAISTINPDIQYIKPKLDELSYSCAIASIFAKNAQVRAMRALDKLYPTFGFSKHKGYGTRGHYDAIKKYGICKVHRKNWIKI